MKEKNEVRIRKSKNCFFLLDDKIWKQERNVATTVDDQRNINSKWDYLQKSGSK